MTKCLEVCKVEKKCNFVPPSEVKPLWDLYWYTSTGFKHLASEASSKFHLLLKIRSEQTYKSIRSSDDVISSPSSVKVRDCLSFIDRNDPESLAHLIVTQMSPALINTAREDIQVLKEILVRNEIYNITIRSPFNCNFSDSSSSSSIGQPAYNRKYDTIPSKKTSTLERFLKRSTWKRWTGTLSWQSSVFSTEALFLSKPRRLEVPIAVFNMDTYKDPRLRYLSIARTGLRILRPIFRQIPPEKLPGMGPYRCIERHVSSAKREMQTAESIFCIDEVMSFVYSFQAYRRILRNDGNVPLVNTNTLFLLYYVLDNCNALASGPRENQSDLVRDRVKSVADMFAGLLLDKCETPTEMADCFVQRSTIDSPLET